MVKDLISCGVAALFEDVCVGAPGQILELLFSFALLRCFQIFLLQGARRPDVGGLPVVHAQHTGRDPARIDHSSIGSVEKAARGTTSRFSTPAAQPAPSDTDRK